MTDESQAHKARDEYSNLLVRLGAHALLADEVTLDGIKTFAVVAFFASDPATPLPKSLQIQSGQDIVQVPLVVRIMEPFSPQ